MRSEADYIDRTIETVRNHKGADNCWPQWANIFADEIEALRAERDALRFQKDALIAERDAWQRVAARLDAERDEAVRLLREHHAVRDHLVGDTCEICREFLARLDGEV